MPLCWFRLLRLSVLQVHLLFGTLICMGPMSMEEAFLFISDEVTKNRALGQESDTDRHTVSALWACVSSRCALVLYVDLHGSVRPDQEEATGVPTAGVPVVIARPGRLPWRPAWLPPSC